MSISALGGSSAYASLLGAQSSSAGGGSGGAGGPNSAGASAESFLMGYTSMTPAQQMQASVLQSMGISQAQYNAMTPQEKAKIQQEIQQKIKQEVDTQTEKKTGLIVDTTA